MKKDRKNAGSKTLLDKSKQINVNMPDYMPEFKPGYGKGKTAAIICMTKYISLSSKLIATKTYEALKNFLIEVYEYDNVFFASTFQGRTTTEFKFFEGCMRQIEEPGCLDDADDIFQVQATLNQFLGYIYSDFFYNVLRVNEWYKKHGDGHYFIIQDDPAIHYLNPFIVFNRRMFEYKTLGHIVPDEIFDEYCQVWPNVEKCIQNCIIAHCGTSYINFLSQLSPKNELTPKFVKKWCSFPLFTYQAMTDNIANKLKSYSYSQKEYDSEYHGYNRGAKRMEKIEDFYTALPNKSLVITSSRNLFRSHDKFDRVQSLFYDDLIPYIGQKAKSTFVIADEITFNDFISPRFFDAMLSDVIAFVYEPYDKNHVYIDDEELKNFMYVATPEDFAEKVNKISNDEQYYKHIKFLQRKAVYNKYKQYCNAESKKIFEEWLKNPDEETKPLFGTPTALF